MDYFLSKTISMLLFLFLCISILFQLAHTKVLDIDIFLVKGKISAKRAFLSDSNEMICQAPSFYGAGKAKIEMKINIDWTNETTSNDKRLFTGYVNVVDKVLVQDQLVIPIETAPDNGSLTLTACFNPEVFLQNFQRVSQKHFISTCPCEDLLMEVLDGHNWKRFAVLKNSIKNTTFYSGLADETLLKDIFEKNRMRFLMITLVRSSSSSSRGKRPSAMINLMNSVCERMRKLYSTMATGISKTTVGLIEYLKRDKICAHWYKNSDSPPNDTLSCPPSFELAQRDGDFENDAVGPALSWFHPGAAHSMRQKIPSNSKAGSQCVYDEAGNLMVGPPGGGTLDRYSPNSDLTLHFIHDVLPYAACCWLGSSESSCNRYYDKRPSDDGTKYVLPAATH